MNLWMLVRRFSNILSLSLFRRLAVGLSAQGLGFDPGSVHVRFLLWHWDMFFPPPPHISPMFHMCHYINSTLIRRTSGRSLGDVRRKQRSLSRRKNSFTLQNLRFSLRRCWGFGFSDVWLSAVGWVGRDVSKQVNTFVLKGLKGLTRMTWNLLTLQFEDTTFETSWVTQRHGFSPTGLNPLFSVSHFKDVTYLKHLQVWIFGPEVQKHVDLSSSFTVRHLKTQICSFPLCGASTRFRVMAYPTGLHDHT